MVEERCSRSFCPTERLRDHLYICLRETHEAAEADGKEDERVRLGKPRIVVEVEFLEWTEADHLRHTNFVGLRDDKDSRTVMREKT
jgi:ATP-dependent DNA ligase